MRQLLVFLRELTLGNEDGNSTEYDGLIVKILSILTQNNWHCKHIYFLLYNAKICIVRYFRENFTTSQMSSNRELVSDGKVRIQDVEFHSPR